MGIEAAAASLDASTGPGTGTAADTGSGTGIDATDVVAELHRRDNTAHAFGIDLVDAGPGRAAVSMVVRPEMCNGYDVCHGGITFTLADTAMAFASGSHNQTALAAAASIDFLSPVPLGSTLRATAEERWLKGRTGLYDVRVELDDGTLVAVFHGRTVRAGGAVVDPVAASGSEDDHEDHEDHDDTDLDTRGGA
ncbi:MAG: hydroxyphenylacetyl-CoA thioesterase PaaI [Ilumatobacteraceae bacterium]